MSVFIWSGAWAFDPDCESNIVVIAETVEYARYIIMEKLGGHCPSEIFTEDPEVFPCDSPRLCTFANVLP